MQEEAKLQAKIIRYLEKHCYCRKIISANKAGTPDIFCCVKGHFVAVEIKSSNGIQSELQKYNQKSIEKNGGKYFLINNYEEFLINFNNL